VKQYFIVIGSKDCRITVWRFDSVKKEVQNGKNYPEILYGHHNEITALCMEKTLNIIISADKVFFII